MACNKKCDSRHTLDRSTCTCKPLKGTPIRRPKSTPSEYGLPRSIPGAPSLKKGGTMKIKKKK